MSTPQQPSCPAGAGHTHRRSPAPIRTAADAHDLVAIAVTRPLQHETLCIPLDAQGQGSVIIAVSGGAEPDFVVDLVDLVTSTMEHSALTALLVVSVRPAADLLPGDGDRWWEISDLAATRGMLVREWLVVGPGGVYAPRDLVGEPERWRLVAR